MTTETNGCKVFGKLSTDGLVANQRVTTIVLDESDKMCETFTTTSMKLTETIIQA